MRMRLLQSVLALGVGALLYPALELRAEDTKTYLSVYCSKAMPGKYAELETFVEQVWKPVVQARVDSGRIDGWAFNRAVAPIGETAHCDYVMTYMHNGVYPDPENTLAADLEKAGVHMTADEFREKRDSLSKLVHHERCVRIDGFGDLAKGDYFQVNFMKPHPGKASEFVKFEKEVWMPLAKAAAEDNHPRKGWAAWWVLYPSGSHQDYDAVTVDFFRDWKSIWGSQDFSKELVEKLHPGKTISEVMQPVSDLRDIVRRELYQVREVIHSPAMASREAQP